MRIALLHNQYDEAHLETVKAEMLRLGAPKIRAIWSEAYGMWMAVEGCHRLRAAESLSISPVIIDVSSKKTLTIQVDGENVKVKVADLEEELVDNAWRVKNIKFSENE